MSLDECGTYNRKQKLLVLGAICLSGLSMPVSFTGPAVALPAIAQGLGGTPIELSWVTNAFMLAFGSSLMIGGSLADRYGRKRLFMLGTMGFAILSLIAMHATSMLWLDTLRALQGVASAAALSSGAAALAQEFEGNARTRAFSLLGTTFGVGLACGPVVAGFLIEHFGWRSVFLSVTAITLLAFALGGWCIHETRDPGATGFDWLGAATFTGALTFFTVAALRVPEDGWLSSPVLALLATSGLIMAAFVIVERRSKRPMLDLSLFRYPRFIGVQFLAAAPAYAYVVLLVLLPQRFIGIEGLDAMTAGQMMFALSAPMLVIPFVAGMLTRWLSAGLISGVGLLLCACGNVWLAQCFPGQSPDQTILAMILIGIGVSLPWGLMDGLAVSVVPKERAGMATGIFNTTRVAGEGIALAIVTALLGGMVQANLATSEFASTSSATLSAAANRLAMGDMSSALQLLPNATPVGLMHSYADAFHLLLYVLAVISVLSAAMVFGLLSHSKPTYVEFSELRGESTGL